MSPSLQTVRKGHIRKVFLHVTRACNLRCRHCYLSAGAPMPDELSTEEIIDLLPQLVELGPQKVIFTGGEPLLRSDLLTCLQALRRCDVDHNLIRAVNTNATLLTREHARLFIGLVDEIRVSLDGTQIIHDRMRGPGTFKAVHAALDLLQEFGFEPKVLVTITTENIQTIRDTVRALLARSVHRINLTLFRPAGRGGQFPALAPTQAQVEMLFESLRQEWPLVFPHAVDVTSCGQQRDCGVGSFLNIMPNGDVYPCHVLIHPDFYCGNVKENRLVDQCAPQGQLTAVLRSVGLRKSH